MPAASPDGLRSYPRPVWILLTAVLINRIGLVVVPMFALYLRERGWSQSAAMATGALYALGATIAAVPAGLLSDRIGRRRALALVTAATGLGMVALGFARGPAILVGIFLVGLFAEAHRPSVTAMLTDLVQPRQRIAVFALLRVVMNVGQTAGPLLAGFIAASQHFSLLFWIDGGTAVAFALIVVLFLPETHRANASPLGAGLRATLADGRVRRLCLGMLPVSTALFLVFAALPIYMRDHLPPPGGVVHSALQQIPIPGLGAWVAERLRTTAASYSVVVFLNALIIVLCEYRFSLWLARFRGPRVLACAAVVTGLGTALFGVARSTDAVFAAMVVLTLGEMLFAPAAMAYLSHIAPSERRGQYLAVFGLTHGVSLILAPLLASALLPQSPRAFWIGSGLLVALAAAGLHRLPEPPPAEAD